MRRSGLLLLFLSLAACSSTSPKPQHEAELKVRDTFISAMEEQSAELVVDARLPATADVTRIFLVYVGGTGADETTTRTKAAANELAEDLLARARAGESFDSLVMAYSDDPDKNTERGATKDIAFEEPAKRASWQPISDVIAQTDEGDYFGPMDVYGGVQLGRVDRKRASYVGLDADDPGIVLRLEGAEYKLARRDGTKYVFSNVAVPKVGKNNAKLVLGSGRVVPFEVHRKMKTLDDWRKYAADTDYQRLLRNAISMTGSPVKLRGRLVQFQEIAADYGWGGIEMWDAGVRAQTGFVYFELEGTTSVDVGRPVMIYGFSRGAQALEMSDGGSRQVPIVEANFVEAL